MADRDFMELQGQEGVYTRDESVETVTLAGRVGVLANIENALANEQLWHAQAEDKMRQD